jgi:hypothetical protein
MLGCRIAYGFLVFAVFVLEFDMPEFLLFAELPVPVFMLGGDILVALAGIAGLTFVLEFVT